MNVFDKTQFYYLQHQGGRTVLQKSEKCAIYSKNNKWQKKAFHGQKNNNNNIFREIDDQK